MSTISRRLALASLPFVFIVAACSGGGASAAPSAAAPTEAPSVAASEAPPAAEGGTIALADNALGSILVDADGMTLYGFTPDEGGTPTCYDDCATAWPPLLADSAAAATVGEGPRRQQAHDGRADRRRAAGRVRRLAAVLLRLRHGRRRRDRPGRRRRSGTSSEPTARSSASDHD